MTALFPLEVWSPLPPLASGVADYVEEVRIEGGEEAVTALFNSAEAYLQMWEKTVDR